MSDLALRRLARRLLNMDAKISRVNSPQLAHSAIVGGEASVPQYDDEGTLVQIIGKQPDGTTGVQQYNAEPPPRPSAPTLSVQNGAVTFHWDGQWEDALHAPLDLSRIDVHIIENATDDPLAVQPVATIASAGWGSAALPVEAGDYFAVLIAWNTSGKWSLSPVSEPFWVEEITLTTDGAPPSTAPVLTARPVGIGAILLEWEKSQGPDATTYRVYGSATEPVDRTEANYHGETLEGDSFVVENSVYGAPAYYVVVPVDDDGEGPVSNTVSATPRQADNESISAEYAYFGDMEAHRIRGGQMFASLAELDKVQTGDTDPRVSLDDTGLWGTTPDGGDRFRLPTDPNQPAVFRGQGEFDSIEVNGGLSIGGIDNEFAKSGRTKIGHATSAPIAPPSVAIEFPVNTLSTDPDWPERGFKKFSDGSWWSFLTAFGDWQLKRRTEDSQGNITGGTVMVSDGVSGPAFRIQQVHDFIEWGDNVLVLLTDESVDGNWYSRHMALNVYNKTTGAYVRSHRVLVPYSDKKAALAKNPNVTNGILIMRADRENGHRWAVAPYVVPTGGGNTTLPTVGFEPVGLVVDDSISSFQVLTQADLIGSGTGQRLVAYRENHQTIYSFTYTSSPTNRFAAEEWLAPSGTGQTAAWFDGARWHTLAQGKVWHLSQFTWSGNAPQRWWARFAWFDENFAGGGQHESLVSPGAPFNMQRFAHFRVTTPQLPMADTDQPSDSVTGVRIYLRPNSPTTPAVSAYARPGTDPAAGVTTVLYGELPPSVSAPNTGTPPGFPMSTPHEIYSENGGLVIRGDGTLEAPRQKQFRPPLLLLEKSGAQPLTASTEQNIVNWTQSAGSNGMDQAGESVLAANLTNGLIQVNRSGYYRVMIYVDWNASSTGNRIVLLRSANGIGMRSQGNGGSGGSEATIFERTVYITAGDVIRPVAYTSSSTSPGLTAYTAMEVEYRYS